MDPNELERRRGLSFAQAEGLEDLPLQLDRKNISSQLKSLMWDVIYRSYKDSIGTYRDGEWSSALKNLWILHYHQLSDEYSPSRCMQLIKQDMTDGDYIKFYGLVSAFFLYEMNPNGVQEPIEQVLEICRSAYRIVEKVLIPVSTDQEANSIKLGLDSATNNKLGGSHKHLKLSMVALSDGRWADSVRESIHAVESAVRRIDGSNSLAAALNQLSKSNHVHVAMNEAFKKLYGWTSDEGGIRHALLEDGDAKVTEADALFMLGACASFVTYLTTNARQAGILQ